MTIQPPPKDTISFPAAAQLVRIDGKPVSPVTIWRWHRFGKHGIHLRAWRRGRQLVTTEAEVSEFERRLAEAEAEHWAERTGKPITNNTSDDDTRAAALGV